MSFESEPAGLSRSVETIINLVLGSPSWARWDTDEEELILEIDDFFYIEIGLDGRGGSAGWSRLEDGSQLTCHPGFPYYDMSPEMHEDLSFVIQVCLDLTYHMAEQRVRAINADTTRLIPVFEGLLSRLIVFIGVALTETPELIREPYKSSAVKALQRDWFS
jgi:hypothetical protein